MARVASAAFVQRLLREHHSIAIALFFEPAFKSMLLDDAIYAAALEAAPHCSVPYWPWLNAPTGLQRYAGKPSAETLAWARRILELIEANGELAAEAKAESGSDHSARSTLKAFEAYRREFDVT